MSEIRTSLKRILCELLKDMEVQEEIKQIVKKDRDQERELQWRIEVLEKEKEVLHYQLEEAQVQCERLQENFRNLEREKTELEIEKITLEKEKIALEKEKTTVEKEKLSIEKEKLGLEKENTVLIEEKKKLQDSKEEIFRQFQNQKKEFEPFEEINEVWQGILKLEKSQKLYLKNLCGSWDVKSFIALGKEKNGIKQLWNFIRDEIMNSNRKTENIRILARFFDLCINVYNITNIRKEHYERIEVLIGKEYDSRQYIKTSESIVNGVVQEVLLNGYYLQDDVMKPIVIVR